MDSYNFMRTNKPEIKLLMIVTNNVIEKINIINISNKLLTFILILVTMPSQRAKSKRNVYDEGL
jgi:hypothetical protein